MVEIIKTSSVVDTPEDILIRDSEGNSVNELLNTNILPKYISFDGSGIDLLDNNKTFYTEGDYKGFISNKTSDENCEIDDYILIKCESNENFKSFFESIKGISIFFYDDCCRELEVTYLDIKDQIYTETITVNSNLLVIKPPTEILLGNLSDIKLIDFTFTKTHLPHQAIKIASIKFGNSVVYNKVKNIELLEEINVLSEDLPINELSFSVIVPESAESDTEFTDGDLINIYSNLTYYGTFYVKESENTAKNTYSVKAQNSLCVLDNIDFREWGLTEIIDEINLYATEEKSDGGYNSYLYTFIGLLNKLTGVKFILPEKDYLTFGHMPINTCRYALCLVAFANALMVDGSRSDKITLKPIPKTISSVITTADKRIIGECKLVKNPPITRAKLQSVTYDSNKHEELSFLKFHIGDENFIWYYPESPLLVYRSPTNEEYYNYRLRIIAPNVICFRFLLGNISEFDIEVGCYKLTPITEDNYIDNENGNPNIKTNVKDFSKLNLLGDIETKKEDVRTYIKSRGVAKGKIRLRGEKVGDLVTIETAYDGMITGIITSLSLHFGYEDIAEIEVLEWPIE